MIQTTFKRKLLSIISSIIMLKIISLKKIIFLLKELFGYKQAKKNIQNSSSFQIILPSLSIKWVSMSLKLFPVSEFKRTSIVYKLDT